MMNGFLETFKHLLNIHLSLERNRVVMKSLAGT